MRRDYIDFEEDVLNENVPREEYVNYIGAIADALKNSDKPEEQQMAASAAEKVATYFTGFGDNLSLECRTQFKNALVDALKLDDLCFRTCCAYALWKIFGDTERAVGTLVSCVEKSLNAGAGEVVDYGWWASKRLGRIGKDASGSAPTLFKCLESCNVYIRLEAIIALGKICESDGEALAKLGSLSCRYDKFFSDSIETAMQRIRQRINK